MQSPSAVILQPTKINTVTLSIVSTSICHEVMGRGAMILVFECWALSQIFHLLFHFQEAVYFFLTFCHKGGVICISEVIDISPSNLDSIMCFIQPGILQMAPHSSTRAWKIPWMEEPGGLQSMGSLRVGHDWATSLSLFTFMHWRRKWQPTPVFLPGESQGRGSLVGCHLWGCTESDTTEAT